jgi:subtilisin family serine protease
VSLVKKSLWRVSAVVLTLLFGTLAETRAVDSLRWQGDRVAAEIGSWDLDQLLEKLVEATGWEIYLEPDTTRTISVKFKDRSQGEALRLLLGDLNFALLPAQGKGAPRLFVFRTSVQEATQLIKAPPKIAEKTAKPIANELIVTLKPGAKIEELAKKLGAKVTGRVDALNTYRLEFESEEAAREARESLNSNSEVESVDMNYPISRPPTPDSLSAGSFMPIDLKPKAGGDGSQVVVAVIDTGIQREGSGIEDFLLSPLSVCGDVQAPDGQPTHGTSMSETVLRGLSLTLGANESRARILPVNVYCNRPTTSTFDVAMGIYQAVNSGARIINLSLGSDGDTGFLHRVIQSSYNQGILFFAAAGNQPVATPTYPAAYPEVIAVTAGTSKGNIASYANFGPFVDVVAPGSSIVNFRGQSWLVMGTSAATAYASGAAAALLDKRGSATSAQVEAQIRSNLGLKKQ